MFSCLVSVCPTALAMIRPLPVLFELPVRLMTSGLLWCGLLVADACREDRPVHATPLWHLCADAVVLRHGGCAETH